MNRYSTVKRVSRHQPGLCPGVTFAEILRNSYPDEKIGLVVNARGASKIAEWQKGENAFCEAVRRAKDASSGSKIAGILWLQGEEDVENEADYINYQDKLMALIKDLREALDDDSIPFIAAEIWGDVELAKKEWQVGIEAVNRQIIGEVEKTNVCTWVSTKGAEHTKEEPVHFSANGLRTIGERFAQAYLKA